MQHDVDPQWATYLQRYRNGEWRALVFRDMILADATALERERGKLSFLDIGCGGGFDSDISLQQSIARGSKQYIGVEPDIDIELGSIYSATCRCCFEDAAIQNDSIDIAFAVMVLEHLHNPQAFWDKLYSVLRTGGVFWGITVDARHWFALLSHFLERLHVKDSYLRILHGRRGEKRYENYGTFYKSNTPPQIQSLSSLFTSTVVLNFQRVGQLDFYFPRRLRWIGRALDRFSVRMGWPGSIMAVRVKK